MSSNLKSILPKTVSLQLSLKHLHLDQYDNFGGTNCDKLFCSQIEKKLLDLGGEKTVSSTFVQFTPVIPNLLDVEEHQ